MTVNVMGAKMQNKTKVLSVRLSNSEFQTLLRACGKTTCHKISEYARKKLFDKALVTTYRNSSLDDLMNELILLRKELNNIGNNFNQAVHKLHMVDNIPEMQIWLTLYDRNRSEVTGKIETIKNKINQLVEVWLQM